MTECDAVRCSLMGVTQRRREILTRGHGNSKRQVTMATDMASVARLQEQEQES
jgi:hypothetical protein